MYLRKQIPLPFQESHPGINSVKPREKPSPAKKKDFISPLPILLFLHLFSEKKGDE